MKIALAQINYRIGDISHNVAKIIAEINKAEKAGLDLIVFSELTICGYPPKDLLTYPDFIAQVEQAVEQIALHCVNIGCIIGAPTRNPKGKLLYNSALLLYQKKVQNMVHKALLPDYDVFDESRYFEAQKEFSCIEFKGIKIALTVCEDIWDKYERVYSVSPMEVLAQQQPQLMINIAASPFDSHHFERRLKVLKDNVLQYKIPLLYVNQVGANTELIFDGGSVVLDAQARVCHQPVFFKEDVFVVDTLGLIPQEMAMIPSIAQVYHALVLGIKDYFNKLGFKEATLGLSGGIDSAVVCALAVEALGAENVNAVLLPSKFSSQHSIADAEALVKSLKCKYLTLPISSVTDAFEEILHPFFEHLPFNIAEENLQARSRGVLLMALSNKFAWMLLNTSNKSEVAVGYGTLYGDMCGSLSVLGDVYKTQVYELAQYINREREIIPLNTITKPPSAELRPDQKDSDSLPDYALLDAILFDHIENKKGEKALLEQGYESLLVKKIVQLVKNAEYKRFQTPPILRVSNKAFGYSRKMPIVAQYDF